MRSSILELTAAGVGVKRAAQALGISPQTVRAVRSSAWERGELDPMKERLGRQYLAAADLLRAEALERIDEIPAQVLLLASAQAADKGQLLTGGATARVERREVPTDLASLVDALPCVSPVGTEEGAANKGPALLASGEPLSVSVADRLSADSTTESGHCVTACATPDASGAPITTPTT